MNEIYNQIRNYNNRMNSSYHFVKKDLRNPVELDVLRFMKVVKSKGFLINEEEFRDAIKNVKFNVSDTCSLGGIAHLLIYFDIPYFNTRINKINPDSVKEIIINKLLSNGLDVDLKDKYGYTFIESAIMGIKHTSEDKFESNNFSFISKLIEMAKEYGVDVNTKNKMGNTIIHTAIGSPYYSGSIVDLIKALGDNFNVMACNNLGQDIINYLDYCINIAKPLTENDDSKEAIIYEETWKNRLKDQREEIINYVQIMSNPLAINPNTRKSFLGQLADLERYVTLNLRIENFLGYPEREFYFDKSVVTFKELNLLKEKEIDYGASLIPSIHSVTRQSFGMLSNEIFEFVVLGKEPTIISFDNLGLKVGKPYPNDKTLNEKIEWLHSVLNILSQQNDKVIGPKLSKIYRSNK